MKHAHSWMLHCANFIHFWWGVVFIWVDRVHPTFGGTRLFSDSIADYASILSPSVWGWTLVVSSAMSWIGQYRRSVLAAGLLIAPQQLIMVMAASHAVGLLLESPLARSTSSGDIVWLAGAYVIGLCIFHTLAVVQYHVRPAQ